MQIENQQVLNAYHLAMIIQQDIDGLKAYLGCGSLVKPGKSWLLAEINGKKYELTDEGICCESQVVYRF